MAFLAVGAVAQIPDTTLHIHADMVRGGHFFLSHQNIWNIYASKPAYPPDSTFRIADRPPSEEEALLQISDGPQTEIWFRAHVVFDSTAAAWIRTISVHSLAAVEIYINGERALTFGSTDEEAFQTSYQRLPLAQHLPERFEAGRETVIDMRTVLHHPDSFSRWIARQGQLWGATVALGPSEMARELDDEFHQHLAYYFFWIATLAALCFLLAILCLLNRRDRVLRVVFLLMVVLLGTATCYVTFYLAKMSLLGFFLLFRLIFFGASLTLALIPYLVSTVFHSKPPVWLTVATILVPSVMTIWANMLSVAITTPLQLGYALYVVLRHRRVLDRSDRWLLAAIGLEAAVMVALVIAITFFSTSITNVIVLNLYSGVFLILPFGLFIYVAVRYSMNFSNLEQSLVQIQQLSDEKLAAEHEKQALIEQQNERLEAQVVERTAELQRSLADLRATQDQLIQQEKLASLGQLTAGIAHEIKNPLNFVTNFSSVSTELLDETAGAIKAEVTASAVGDSSVSSPPWSYIFDDLASIRHNLEKIHEHGSRADRIVKSMLQHSRTGTAEKTPTDLNALVREFTNLSFHGMRAGEKRMDCDVVYDLDDSVGEVPLVAQDFSRVILNLTANAFDAMYSAIRDGEEGDQRSVIGDQNGAGAGSLGSGYRPKLTVRTRREGNRVVVEVEDNGPGIPEHIKDKIFQPFFTTKKGTEGTGLGLSISHDIVMAHGGGISVESPEGKGTLFKIVISG